MTNSTRRHALMMGLSATALLAGGRAGSALAAGARPGSPPLPSDLAGGRLSDRRAWAANATARTPIDLKGRNAFMKRKLFTARTHPRHDRQGRNRAVQQLANRFGMQSQPLLDQPVPGGVGYGLFFNEDYKTAWGAGTATTFDLICPPAPGGNVDSFLYLTATNRAALGAEGFVSYFGQNDARFKIYDWAQASANPWQADIALDLLAEAYLHPMGQARHELQTLSVWNTTYSLGGRFYRNEVFLYNHQEQSWDSFYQYDYAADEAQQKSGWTGSWGPIVETFQPLYSDTNPMGVRRTQLTESDAYGRWNDWSRLEPDNSYVRTDNQGFDLQRLMPNFSFIAVS